MKQKTVSILYWTTTILFSIAILMGVIPSEQGKAVMAQLGYPMYVLTILGAAKVLGVIGLFQTRYSTLKEWAYAGFTFDILGAAASFAFIGQGIQAIPIVVIFLGLLGGSYYTSKKRA